ncbi:hypothetical protein ENBRE01_0230 [Enteropsectra breve]|nr:hypothetical protein ENBRE01_0230 [Enteropsectra breve]
MNLRQIIFLRTDLGKTYGKGAIIAQACHASTYALHAFRNSTATVEYLADAENMTKIILKISEPQIDVTMAAMYKNKINFIRWIEKPEEILTAMATEPLDLSAHAEFEIFLRKFKLY